MLILLKALKVVEGMSFLDTKILHNSDINNGSVVQYVTNVVNGYTQLQCASRCATTLSKVNGGFIEWDASYIAKHIENFLKERLLYTCLECKY